MLSQILFFISIYQISLRLLKDECVAPPLECPNANISFWLYTRDNSNNPHELKTSESNSITSAPWVKNAPVKILLHGYTGHRDFSPNVEIRPAYLECCNYNIISVDYNKVALEPCYVQAVRNIELVGMCTAQLIDQLVQEHGWELSNFHIIGFSLGAHASGYIQNNLKTGKLERISALDPALPLFATKDKNNKVDPDDAHFVDVLHTNVLEKGKLESSGHVDFFANGGMFQPGCRPSHNQRKLPNMESWHFYQTETDIRSKQCLSPSSCPPSRVEVVTSTSGCNHARAPLYFAESIITNKGFYARKCYSWFTYMIGLCGFIHSSEEILFGEHVPRSASGIYFFNTNSKSPYAHGSRDAEFKVAQDK